MKDKRKQYFVRTVFVFVFTGYFSAAQAIIFPFDA
jgi:hypothetical protein